MASIKISGDTSGEITISAPAVAGTNTLTLPAESGNLLTSVTTGTILQVVSTTKTDAFSKNAVSTFADITGLSVSITPSSTSNKILILGNVFLSGSSTSALALVNLVRDSTNISQGVSCTTFADMDSLNDVDRATFNQPINFLDSPSTTSSTTYKLQIKSTNDTVYVNRRGLNTSVGSTSTITVMEIAG